MKHMAPLMVLISTCMACSHAPPKPMVSNKESNTTKQAIEPYYGQGFRMPLDCTEYMRSPFPNKDIERACTSPHFLTGEMTSVEHILRTLDEPSLSVGIPADTVSYRLLIRPSFSGSIMVRVEKNPEHCRMLVKRAEAAYVEVFEMSEEEWQTFTDLLAQDSFWTQPTHIPYRGLDGATYIIEGAMGGRYHAVSRWSPETGKFREAFQYIFVLAGIWHK